ncbi:MAG: IS1380 family transposase, partial [Streptosporangiales bacterium]|nr:IS1380 family transposase [Streptosporangiales bacterium]
DRIREAKATGLRNLPSHNFATNAAWLETILAAIDLIAWTQTVCFADIPELAHCEIHTFRYRVLHTAARLARTGRQLRLRLDRTWRWTTQIAAGFDRLRAAFT